MIRSMAKKTQTPPKTFEDALTELEQILAEIESGEMGLEESLTKYERGNFLIQHCRGVLNSAERQIELLNRSAEDTNAGTGAAGAAAGADAGTSGDDDGSAAGGEGIDRAG